MTLNAARFADRLRSLLGVRGGPAIDSHAPTLGAYVCLEAERPETEISGGFRLWTVRQSVAAVAAQTSHVLILNPANSGVIVVVTSVKLGTAPGNSVFVGQRNRFSVNPPAGFVNNNAVIARDFRVHNNAGGNLQCTVQEWSVSDGTATYSVSILETLPVAVDVRSSGAPYVLGEGDGLVIENSAVNQALDISVAGYERARVPGEKV